MRKVLQSPHKVKKRRRTLWTVVTVEVDVQAMMDSGVYGVSLLIHKTSLYPSLLFDSQTVSF